MKFETGRVMYLLETLESAICKGLGKVNFSKNSTIVDDLIGLNSWFENNVFWQIK